MFRTKVDGPPSVFNGMRCLDVVVQPPQGRKFAERWCIYDRELIPNFIIYPI